MALSAAALRKIGNVRVPSDWQPFGGFNDYASDVDDDMYAPSFSFFVRTPAQAVP